MDKTHSGWPMETSASIGLSRWHLVGRIVVVQHQFPLQQPPTVCLSSSIARELLMHEDSRMRLAFSTVELELELKFQLPAID